MTKTLHDSTVSMSHHIFSGIGKANIVCIAIAMCTTFSNAQTSLPMPSIRSHDIRLTDSAVHTDIKNQGKAGLCWAFGTLALLEGDLLRQHNTSMDLSEIYIARYAYIDKARAWLKSKGKTYYEGGGQFHDVIRVIQRFGILPESAYSGKSSPFRIHDHRQLDSAMRRLAQSWLDAGKVEMNDIDTQQMNDTLDKYLGAIPKTFSYNGKQYTAKEFAADVVGFGDQYLEMMSFANLPLYKRSRLVDKFNWSNDSLYNVTLDDMVNVVDTALANGWSVVWEGDVTEQGFQLYKGLATAETRNYDYARERVTNFGSELTERDHMMTIVGAGRDSSGQKWYYLKNSWGFLGPYRGYMYMNETYFRLKTVNIMVNKKGLPRVLRKALQS